MKYPIYVIFAFVVLSCQSDPQPEIEIAGELKQWHKVTLLLNGPESSEGALENPFLHYKLDVVFTKGNSSYKVPGYFAADGNAGESSATGGHIWKIHFRPDEAGTWHYKVSFRKGKNISILEGEDLGEPVAPDGIEGSLEIGESDKGALDFRGQGRIVNGGKGYFKFQGTDRIWIKNGADSPENFLAYEGFDQTSRFSLKAEFREGEANPRESLHTYESHINDWEEGNPVWQIDKGKGIIGTLNYLQSVGVNSVYMLTMNILGDGNDVWPYMDYNERYRFDCSKLDQWELVFDHMEQLGIMAHFVLQETENECLLDIGQTGVQRRIYLREMIARFGHHLALTWNLGEENGPAHWTPIGQTDAQKKAMASYLKRVNPYPCNVVLHTHSNDEKQDEYLNPMLGYEDLDGPSMQVGNPLRVHERVRKWIEESEKAGKRWMVSLDEIGPAWKGAMPDSHDANHDTIRANCLWGTLLAGGSGVEWYFGYRFPHNDLECEDFRSRANWWKQSAIATQFVNEFPLEDMRCMDELVQHKGTYCLAKPGEIYMVYLPAGSKNVHLRLESGTKLSVRWFDPRNGSEALEGSVASISGAGIRSLGNPPSDPEKDWVVIVH
ncbi:MAG: DUF5060 domain-containing protein [Bacteroidota bacterium]